MGFSFDSDLALALALAFAPSIPPEIALAFALTDTEPLLVFVLHCLFLYQVHFVHNELHHVRHRLVRPIVMHPHPRIVKKLMPDIGDSLALFFLACISPVIHETHKTDQSEKTYEF